MMKRFTILFALVAVLAVGCHRDKKELPEFETKQINASFTTEEGSELRVDLEWPEPGQLSEPLMLELVQACFLDSTTNLDEAIQSCLTEMDAEATSLHALGEMHVHSTYDVSAKCKKKGNIVEYYIFTDRYCAGAPHGWYASNHLMIDRSKGMIVRVEDLMDTNRLKEVLPIAVHELDTNADVLNNIFEEYATAEKWPMPSTFFIDSARRNICFEYGLYGIASYASGIQTVVMPVEWLAERVPLTAYAKELMAR